MCKFGGSPLEANMQFISDDPVLRKLCVDFYQLRSQNRLLGTLFNSVRSAGPHAMVVPLIKESEVIIDYCPLQEAGFILPSPLSSSGFLLTSEGILFIRQLLSLIDKSYDDLTHWTRDANAVGDMAHFSSLITRFIGYQTEQAASQGMHIPVPDILANSLIHLTKQQTKKP
jgi:hypothetical protein